ncbi:hypothetical protein [Nocardia aurea]|uniref:hypothetical protein n=1 Tax=Nocardia aurea TaxID=2144174 RepID=UPI0033AA063E
MNTNTTIMFYNGETGAAGTGRLSGGHWTQHDTVTSIPAGYTHAAAGRDTLIFYEKGTGRWESGTLTDGFYTRRESGDGFSDSWSHVEATADTVLFYDEKTGHAASGRLTGGVYREVRGYGDFKVGWAGIAGSADTMAFAKNVGHGDLPNYILAFGSLTDGTYSHRGEVDGVVGIELTATTDSLLLRVPSPSSDTYQIAKMIGGTIGPVHDNGTSGHWDRIGRTADSLFFYKNDGTAWISTLSGGSYANVGALPGVSSGWSIIEGGV